MGRRGTNYDRKMEAVEKYKRGEGSQDSIAREYGLHKSSFQQWLTNYEAMGTFGLSAVNTNTNIARN